MQFFLSRIMSTLPQWEYSSPLTITSKCSAALHVLHGAQWTLFSLWALVGTAKRGNMEAYQNDIQTKLKMHECIGRFCHLACVSCVCMCMCMRQVNTLFCN